MFAEYPDQPLSVPEIISETGKARRAVYYTVQRLLSEGIIVESGRHGKAKLYVLNQNDIRARMLPALERVLVLGSIESELRKDLSILPIEGLSTDVVDKSEGSDNIRRSNHQNENGTLT
jgi:biotin operon repressor